MKAMRKCNDEYIYLMFVQSFVIYMSYLEKVKLT